MNDKVEDRRVRKTKKYLRESLADLMTQKNIRDISIQELTDHADLNRATFYLHYKDIYELQEQIEKETVNEVNQILDNFLPADKNADPYALFLHLLEFIQQNANLSKMLLGENSPQSFIDKLCVIVEERCIYNWLYKFRSNVSAEDMLYFSSFLVHGYVAVIAKWVQSGMGGSTEEVAMLLNNMGLHSITFLESK